MIGALSPWAARGSLLNFAGGVGPQEVGALWADDDRARLVDLEKRLDPDGMFVHGHVVG